MAKNNTGNLEKQRQEIKHGFKNVMKIDIRKPWKEPELASRDIDDGSEVASINRNRI